MSSQVIVKPLTAHPLLVYRATHDAPQRRALLVGAAGLEGVAPIPAILFSSLSIGSRALLLDFRSPFFPVGQSAQNCCQLLDFSEQDPDGVRAQYRAVPPQTFIPTTPNAVN